MSARSITFAYPDGSVAADGIVLEIEPGVRVVMAFTPRWDPGMEAEGPGPDDLGGGGRAGGRPTKLTLTTAMIPGSHALGAPDRWATAGVRRLRHVIPSRAPMPVIAPNTPVWFTLSVPSGAGRASSASRQPTSVRASPKTPDHPRAGGHHMTVRHARARRITFVLAVVGLLAGLAAPVSAADPAARSGGKPLPVKAERTLVKTVPAGVVGLKSYLGWVYDDDSIAVVGEIQNNTSTRRKAIKLKVTFFDSADPGGSPIGSPVTDTVLIDGVAEGGVGPFIVYEPAPPAGTQAFQIEITGTTSTTAIAGGGLNIDNGTSYVTSGSATSRATSSTRTRSRSSRARRAHGVQHRGQRRRGRAG